ncbi:uncharacterized protein LOC116304906 [Actinia tenebrosa]|uniref:Uncharacterized protein LOC116304906 n=1 Tax=Actinia tenebrosa TaxID=6105 RepID=A0A6P8IU38_ACTTE|nr:uncharacterized protein LOC116304906 [Actinia tenebrosa]
MGQIVLDSYEGVLFIQVFIGVLSICGVLGNTLVVLSVLRNRSMHTVMYYLLINLGIADTLVAVFLLMRYVFADSIVYPFDVRADVICKFVSFGTISWVGLHAQVFTLIVISVERYSAVVHPYSSRGRLNKKKLKIVLVVCWMYAIGFIMPDFIAIRYDQKKASCIYEWSDIIQKTWAFLWFFACGPVPLLSMGLLYGKVVYDLWIKKDGRVSESRKAVIRSRKRVTKVVITVTIIYGICWLPNLTLWLTANFITIPHLPFIVTLTHVFLLFNSSVNPFVYSVQSQHFRKCMLRTLHFWKPSNSVTSHIQDTNTNTNTGSVNAIGGIESRDINNCQSSVVLEGRVPSGIIQKPHRHLETKKRFSLVKAADCHANTVHPVHTVVVEKAGCHSNVGCQENELLTIEKGFQQTTVQQTSGKESKDKDFSVFQVNAGASESSESGKAKFEQKHLLVKSNEKKEIGDFGGIWMGPNGDDNKEDFYSSVLQTPEEKESRDKKIRTAFIKVRAFTAFAQMTGDMKKEKNNITALYPSFLDDLKTRAKENNLEGEDVAKGKQGYRDEVKQHTETAEEHMETGNLNYSREEAVSASEEGNHENNGRNETLDSNRKNSSIMESTTSSSNGIKIQRGSKKISFIELPDDIERKELVLPRINQARTPLVTAKHYTGYGSEKSFESFDKTSRSQEREKLKLLRG